MADTPEEIKKREEDREKTLKKLNESIKRLTDTEDKSIKVAEKRLKEISKTKRQLEGFDDLGKQLTKSLLAPLQGLASAIPAPLRILGKMAIAKPATAFLRAREARLGGTAPAGTAAPGAPAAAGGGGFSFGSAMSEAMGREISQKGVFGGTAAAAKSFIPTSWRKKLETRWGEGSGKGGIRGWIGKRMGGMEAGEPGGAGGMGWPVDATATANYIKWGTRFFRMGVKKGSIFVRDEESHKKLDKLIKFLKPIDPSKAYADRLKAQQEDMDEAGFGGKKGKIDDRPSLLKGLGLWYLIKNTPLGGWLIGLAAGVGITSLGTLVGAIGIGALAVVLGAVVITGLIIAFRNWVSGWEEGGIANAISSVFYGDGPGGWKNAFKQMFVGAAFGAIVGGLVGFGLPGAIAGALIGAAIFGILGFIGKDKIDEITDNTLSALDSLTWRALDALNTWLKRWFRDPVEKVLGFFNPESEQSKAFASEWEQRDQEIIEGAKKSVLQRQVRKGEIGPHMGLSLEEAEFIQEGGPHKREKKVFQEGTDIPTVPGYDSDIPPRISNEGPATGVDSSPSGGERSRIQNLGTSAIPSVYDAGTFKAGEITRLEAKGDKMTSDEKDQVSILRRQMGYETSGAGTATSGPNMMTGMLSNLQTPSGLQFQVAQKYAANFGGLLDALSYSHNYGVRNIIGYRQTKMESGEGSMHAWGAAIDLNRRKNPQSYRLRSDLPGVWKEAPQGGVTLTEARDGDKLYDPVTKTGKFGTKLDQFINKKPAPGTITGLAASYGLGWGGNFTLPDTMHFTAMGGSGKGYSSYWDEGMKSSRGDAAVPFADVKAGAITATIPKLAKGGTLSGAAIVGEAGPELVVGDATVIPLDRAIPPKYLNWFNRWLGNLLNPSGRPDALARAMVPGNAAEQVINQRDTTGDRIAELADELKLKKFAKGGTIGEGFKKTAHGFMAKDYAEKGGMSSLGGLLNAGKSMLTQGISLGGGSGSLSMSGSADLGDGVSGSAGFSVTGGGSGSSVGISGDFGSVSGGQLGPTPGWGQGGGSTTVIAPTDASVNAAPVTTNVIQNKRTDWSVTHHPEAAFLGPNF